MHGMFNALSGYAVIAVNGGNNLLKLPVGVAGIIAMGVLVLVLFLVMRVFRRFRVEPSFNSEQTINATPEIKKEHILQEERMEYTKSSETDRK